MASNSDGNDGQKLKHIRQRWQTSKTRRSSLSSSAASQYFGSRMSNIRQVPCQRLRGAGGDGGAMRVERMVRHHAHARAARQRLALQGIDAEADELQGADEIAVELAAVEERRGDAGADEVAMQMAIETDTVAKHHVEP